MINGISINNNKKIIRWIKWAIAYKVTNVGKWRVELPKWHPST